MIKNILFFAVVGLLITGCTQVAQPNTPIKLYTPSKYSVIKLGSKIYFQTENTHGYDAKKLINSVQKHFKKEKVFKIVSNKKNADVIITIDTFYSFRQDNNQDVRYNQKDYVERIVYKNGKGKETGGRDVLKNKTFKSTTATLIASVSIYERKILQPLVYFNIMPSSSSKTVNNKSKLLSNNDYISDLTQNVVKKIEDLVSTKSKDVNIFLPAKCDLDLKTALLSANTDTVFVKAKEILPEFDVLDATQKKYDDIALAASVKDSKIIKRDIETDLSNFYLLLVAKESIDVSKTNMVYVYKGLQNILKLTKDPSLILAVSNSLGRIEFKAKRLNINLGADNV